MAGADPFTAGFNALSLVIDKLFPDPETAAKAKVMLLSQEMAPMMAQIEVNKAEAASGSMFVAGWRPFIGWGLGACLVMSYGVGPCIEWFGHWFFTIGWVQKIPPKFPSPDAVVMELLMGMLGFGAMRSYEKIKGIASTAIAGKK